MWSVKEYKSRMCGFPISKYLGSHFRSDDSHLDDVKARIVTSISAAGKIHEIWSRKSTPLRLKMRIYKSDVCSRLTYDSETCRLDAHTRKMLNGANNRLVTRITNRGGLLTKKQVSRQRRSIL